MTFHALLSAAELTEDGSGLRATRSIAGQYVVERQARLCRDAGATRIFAYVETMTDDLVSAFERMRDAGLIIEPVRKASEIVDRTSSRDGLIIMLDGLVVGSDQVAMMASGTGYAILVTDDTPITRPLERIDANRRWAGLALARCGMLGDLVDVPDDWNLVSTVLRRIVQKEAAHLPCDPAMFERGDLCVIDADEAAAAMSELVYETSAVGETGLITANVLAPLARIVGPPLLRAGARARTIENTGMALMAGAALLLGFGFITGGSVVGMLGIGSMVLGRYMDLFTMERPRPNWLKWILSLLPTMLILLAAIRVIAVDSKAFGIAAMIALYALASAQAICLESHLRSTLARRTLPDPALGLMMLGIATATDFFAPILASTAMVGAILILIALATKKMDQSRFISN